MNREVTIAVVGAGVRGTSHAKRVARSGGARVVAVAEPNPDRRKRMVGDYDIPRSRTFSDWRDLAQAPRCADAVIITTQDALHVEPCERLAALGYHIMLEKPMAPTEAESERIVNAVERAGVILAVCHVLRYSPYTQTLKKLVGSGRLGDLVNIQHLEPVGWWHFAHSYVRGNWRREDQSSSLLMAKCCHDLDWIGYLVGRHAARVASFGSLVHFTSENRPSGAASRCLDCPVEPACPYSAPRLYLGCLEDPDSKHWPLGPVTADATVDGVVAALRTGPYGRCVYDCDNDAVDQQVVIIEYEEGPTATHTVTAFTEMAERKTRIFGSHGCVDGDGARLVITDFVTGKTETITVVDDRGRPINERHGGGDQALVNTFVSAISTDDPSQILSGPRESLHSHRVVWAAEQSRRSNTVTSLASQERIMGDRTESDF